MTTIEALQLLKGRIIVPGAWADHETSRSLFEGKGCGCILQHAQALHDLFKLTAYESPFDGYGYRALAEAAKELTAGEIVRVGEYNDQQTSVEGVVKLIDRAIELEVSRVPPECR